MVARVAYTTNVLIALSCSAVSIGMQSTAHVVTSNSRHAGMAWGHLDVPGATMICNPVTGYVKSLWGRHDMAG